MIKIDTFYIKMVYSLKFDNIYHEYSYLIYVKVWIDLWSIIVPFQDFIGVFVLIGVPECYLFWNPHKA